MNSEEKLRKAANELGWTMDDMISHCLKLLDREKQETGKAVDQGGEYSLALRMERGAIEIRVHRQEQ